MEPTITSASTSPFTPSTPAAAARRVTLGRLTVFGYGVACYALGVAGLVWLIAATLGLVPLGTSPVSLAAIPTRVAVDVGLVALFGIQHAVMARARFKERWARVFPAATTRATFTALSGVLMALAMWLWQPLGASLWVAEDPLLRGVLLALCVFGWAYLFLATFAIDHFELFGLRQVWGHLRGEATDSPAFRARLMYRFDRHPIMTGALVGLWCTPDLTLDRLVLAVTMTAYVVIGVTLEERDLVGRHGQRYVDYARRVGTIVPRLSRFG